jgi:membrane protease YdiL (CAAX protease family)
VKCYIRALFPRLEFGIVVVGAFGSFVAGSVLAFFDPSGPVPISNAQLQDVVVYELVAAAILLTFLRIRNWTLQSVGVSPSLQGTLVGVGLAAAAYLIYVVVFLISAVLSPHIAQVVAAQALVAPGLNVALVIAASIVNPVFEELFVCGYVVTALREHRGFWTAVNVSIAIRLLYHLYQGPIGVLSIIPLGFVFAHWLGRTARLWPVIVAHAIFDFLGLLAGG